MGRPDYDLNINHLQQWFANIVDIINENYRLIEAELPSLALTLTTVDTAPIDDIKNAFDQLQSKIEMLENQLNNKGLLL